MDREENSRNLEEGRRHDRVASGLRKLILDLDLCFHKPLKEPLISDPRARQRWLLHYQATTWENLKELNNQHRTVEEVSSFLRRVFCLPALFEPIKRLGLGFVVVSNTPLDDLEHTRWDEEELEDWIKNINKYYKESEKD